MASSSEDWIIPLVLVGLAVLGVVGYWLTVQRADARRADRVTAELLAADVHVLQEAQETDGPVGADGHQFNDGPADADVHTPVGTDAWFLASRFDLVDTVAKALLDTTRDPDRITPWDMAVVAIDTSKDAIRADERARLTAAGWVPPDAHDAVVAAAKARVELWLRKSFHEQVDELPSSRSIDGFVLRRQVLEVIDGSADIDAGTDPGLDLKADGLDLKADGNE